eukprot:6173205-Pleurochrysis_carterae.AAC.2
MPAAVSSGRCPAPKLFVPTRSTKVRLGSFSICAALAYEELITSSEGLPPRRAQKESSQHVEAEEYGIERQHRLLPQQIAPRQLALRALTSRAHAASGHQRCRERTDAGNARQAFPLIRPEVTRLLDSQCRSLCPVDVR